MDWLRKIIRSILPVDSSNDCGYGPFKLPHEHPFTRACTLHDYDFLQSHAGRAEKSINQADADLFWRWALIAHAEQDATKRCKLFEDICEYWPLARLGGKILWTGPRTDVKPIID